MLALCLSNPDHVGSASVMFGNDRRRIGGSSAKMTKLGHDLVLRFSAGRRDPHQLPVELELNAVDKQFCHATMSPIGLTIPELGIIEHSLFTRKPLYSLLTSCAA